MRLGADACASVRVSWRAFNLNTTDMGVRLGITGKAESSVLQFIGHLSLLDVACLLLTSGAVRVAYY